VNLLLGGKALYSFLVGTQHETAERDDRFCTWASGPQDYRAYFTSELTVATLRASILEIQDIWRRESIHREFDRRLIVDLGLSSLVRVDAPMLMQWSSLRADLGPKTTITLEEQIEIATALHYGYVYIAPLKETLKQLQTSVHDLKIVDPWAS
jgi:hypothetical protein